MQLSKNKSPLFVTMQQPALYTARRVQIQEIVEVTQCALSGTQHHMETIYIAPGWYLYSIVLTTTGGWGTSASVMYKRLGSLIAGNTGSPYNQVMRMIRRRISFVLIDASIMCLQGARFSLYHPKRMNLSDS